MTTNEKPADADLLRFVGLMEERLGLYFDAAEHNRVGILMHERMRESGCSSFSGYEQRMCDGSGEELRVLASKLTVPETYFFRNPEQFVALAQSVMPQLRLGQPARRIRILSVGCSSGEEPFTIAMTLKEMPDFDLSLVSIIGIDVNPKCIEKGRRGRFAKWSMRTMPEHYKKYLRPNHNEFALDEGVRAMVRLEEGNLAVEDANWWRPESYEIIFCRNVLMYFSPEKMTESVARLARSISADGFLFLGQAETLRGISTDFHLRHSHECFYYSRRRLEAEDRQAAQEARLADHQAPAPSKPADRGGVLAGLETGRPELGGAPDFGLAAQLAVAGRAREALDLLLQMPPEQRDDPDAVVLTAAILAERGRAQEAAQLCSTLLASDDLNPSAQYLMGFCDEQRGLRAAAIESYRAAIYLDPGFALPHLRLGQLFRREGDLGQARRELAEASILLAGESSARILLFGNGFSRAALIDLCRSELRLCGGQR